MEEKGKRTHYTATIKPLQGKQTVFPGSSTDKVLHHKACEIEPGIMIAYCIDAFDGKIYIDPQVKLTW